MGRISPCRLQNPCRCAYNRGSLRAGQGMAAVHRGADRRRLGDRTPRMGAWWSWSGDGCAGLGDRIAGI